MDTIANDLIKLIEKAFSRRGDRRDEYLSFIRRKLKNFQEDSERLIEENQRMKDTNESLK